ncbi:MAG: hypothetical protein JW934_05445 [Anaerolineae bacterium]|nr:hypothetical protein [Anaerolineae bacterium]
MNTRIAIRWFVVALVVLAVIGGAALLLWRLSMQRPSAWREKLTWYVDLLNQDDGRIAAVHETVHARAPERFLAEMSHWTWGDSTYFSTNQNSSGVGSSALLPLPFPATDLWCAMLTYKYTTDPALGVLNTWSVVFVALHGDLYRAEWVVHTLALGGDLEAAETKQILSEVGCQFQDVPVSDSRQTARRLPAQQGP